GIPFQQTSAVRSSAPCNRCDCRCARSSWKIHLTISTGRFERGCRAKHKCCMCCRALRSTRNARTSRNSRSGIACQQCSSSELTSRRGGSCFFSWVNGPHGGPRAPSPPQCLGGGRQTDL